MIETSPETEPTNVARSDWWPSTLGDLRAALATVPQDLHVARDASGDIVLMRQLPGAPRVYSYAAPSA